MAAVSVHTAGNNTHMDIHVQFKVHQVLISLMEEQVDFHVDRDSERADLQQTRLK